ncbi:MAG: amino acid adenylation domain-containing protein [Cyanosarcina radialis HA8281-LM2]|jgi:amino acid adenylation domain-containing protein/thioester reductase-like protein|nr:amino acid adenylation domain-containing protein [Cyanosarcina radialis HA8281-LM2]
MQSLTIQGFRLSPQQKHLWSLQQDSCEYRAQCTIQISGNLNVEVLKLALQEIGARHEILRTKFEHQPGMKFPLQVIGDRCNLSWEAIDVCPHPGGLADTPLPSLGEGQGVRAGFSVSLVVFGKDQYLLNVELPSMYADSYSLKNLFLEITETYNACLNNKKLTDEVFQYIQFSEWQNELLQDDDAAIGQNYWQGPKFSASPILPFEKKATEDIQFSSDVYGIKLETQLTQKIAALANRCHSTIADLLFACWQTLIYRIVGKSEFAIATPFSGRKYEELDRCLGLLAKYLPVGCALENNFKISEVVAQLRETLQQHEKWQEYGDIVESPISFEFVELPENRLAGGVTFTLEKLYAVGDRFKVKLACIQQEESLTTEWHYDRQLIDRGWIEYLAEQFQALLVSVVNNPEATIGQLDILSDRQLQQLLIEFNQTSVNYPQNKCVHQLFENQVERSPDAIAIVFGDKQLTYREVNTRADLLAGYLQQLGVGKEVIVGIYLERSPEVIIALLAILKAGGAYLPIDPALPPAGLIWRLQDAKAPVLITQQSLAANLPKLTTQIVYLENLPANPAYGRGALAKPCPPGLLLCAPTSLNNLAYVIYTSGSTGKPKGVAVEHQQILNYLHGILDRSNLPAGASYATVSTFAADLGNTAIFPALCTGGCLHIISQEIASDPVALADYCDRYPIDCLKIVPSHLATLLANSSSPAILPRQRLILGGEVANWELIAQIQALSPDCQIINHYGPTETTVGVLTYPVKNRPDCAATVPLGSPLPNTQVYILDRYLKPVPIGVTGELYIGGSLVSRGYLNQPELTAEKFIRNPFEKIVGAQSFDKLRNSFAPLQKAVGNLIYKTGDLARYLPDGNIEFLGRMDSQVKIRGFRVELGEIETVLSQHPQVQQVAVSIWEEKPGDRRLVAYIGPRQQKAPTLSDIRSFLREKLPEYTIPSALIVLKALPLTSNGKIDRRSLPIPSSDRSEAEAIYIAPRTPTEAKMAAIWAKILGLERVGIHDNFFELGGHSLLLTQLLVQVREAFDTDLSLNTLFTSPTVASLVDKIDVSSQTESLDRFIPNWDIETILDRTINPFSPSPHLPISPSPHLPISPSLLLTGATGFLGAFLLYELLQQTDSNIYCLVRASNVELAKAKLQDVLEAYLLWDEAFSSRIIPVLGDLSKSLLGLSSDEFAALADRIDAIYHNGAWVHHSSDYYTLKPANVLGTQEILRLACQTKTKPLHFISTISVFDSDRSDELTLIKETDSLGDRPPNSNGYVQSKWVAEKLVNTARERGLPVSIYRPGRISGHSQTGVFNPNDLLYRLIIGCIQLGSIAKDDESLELAPVDYVSRAIVHLSKQPESLGKAFHLVNHHPLLSSSIFKSIRSFGYSIKEVSDEQWHSELIEIAQHSPEHPLYPLVPFFSIGEGEAASNSGAIAFDCQNAIAGLTGTSIVCPPIDEQILHTYFSYLIQSGVLTPSAYRSNL